jgi:hypothetical protein
MMCRLAANVVRCDERLATPAVPHRNVEWIAVAIGGPDRDQIPSNAGKFLNIDAVHVWIRCEKVDRSAGTGAAAL